GKGERGEERVVGWQLVRLPAPKRLAHAVRQHPAEVRDSGHDARHEIVLQIEDCVRLKRTVVAFRPEVRPCCRVDQLHGDAQLGAGLPDRTFHHVPGPDLLPTVRTSVVVFAYRAVELRAITRRYENRESPVMISSARPSASPRRSALAPAYLKGSTATQKPCPSVPPSAPVLRR